MRNNLTNFRKKLGMTQEEFGKLLGISKDKVCLMEYGIREGTPKEWLTIQKIFKLSNEETLKLLEVVQDETT